MNLAKQLAMPQQTQYLKVCKRDIIMVCLATII
jgi:hypothetical protein